MTAAVAAEEPVPAPPPAVEVVPSLAIHRTEVAPVIDGVLDDEAWAGAAAIPDLTQLEPIEGAPATHRTEIRIAFDTDAIYFGVRCFDDQPDLIIANTMIRDASFGPDDRFAIVLDPFFDRRNAYFFELNPAGAKGDALIQDNRRFIRDWDGIWYGKASIDEKGWVAEIAIPFKTIAFNPETDQWGFNAQRTVRRINETTRWSGVSQNKSLNSVADAGIIQGIEGIDDGIGLDIVPYGLARYTDPDEGDSDFEVDAGADLFYKLTPSMTLALTINTDFAETEVDQRRVNLTRFPLFFPEKRDFFLQDAGIFNFGAINRNPLPFQSRRIGLSPDGEPVDIIVGAKLTGRTGPLNVGVLSVYQDGVDDLDEKLLSVGRFSLNVLEESTVGIIATNGDPQTDDDNTIAGADFNFRTSTYDGDKIIESNSWFQHSSSSGDVGDDQAFGTRVNYPNDRVSWRFGFSEIGDQFNAALGFVPRRGIREYFGNWRYRWRPEGSWIRTIDSGVNGMLITDLDDDTESASGRWEVLDIGSNDGDSVSLDLRWAREVLDGAFEIQPGVVIEEGDYDWVRYGARASSSTGRPISVSASIEGGDFYDGDRLDATLGVQWRPSRHFFLSASMSQNDVDLPGGDFTVRIATVRVNFLFTPDVSWTNFVQYDNVSDSVGINSRFRWIFEPGREMFVVVNQAFDYDNSRLSATDTDLTTKVGWTFRF